MPDDIRPLPSAAKSASESEILFSIGHKNLKFLDVWAYVNCVASLTHQEVGLDSTSTPSVHCLSLPLSVDPKIRLLVLTTPSYDILANFALHC